MLLPALRIVEDQDIYYHGRGVDSMLAAQRKTHRHRGEESQDTNFRVFAKEQYKGLLNEYVLYLGDCWRHDYEPIGCKGASDFFTQTDGEGQGWRRRGQCP